MTHPHSIAHGTSGDDILDSTRGGVFARGGDDTITATASDDRSQIHSYAASGDDLTYLDFDIVEGFAHGHHARGGDGADVFDFTNINNVSGFVSGRIEDFDIRSDVIRVEGEALDFGNLPDNVRVVGLDGDHDDLGSHPQPYLHISTPAGGDIFYALEGARVDMSRADSQEPHFLSSALDPWALDEIEYTSPNNYLPDNHDPISGETIRDVDVVRADVLKEVVGSDRDDLIAAGLNDDTVRSGAGDDTVWGGSGNDVIFGGRGDDRIEGSTGNDHLLGESGHDTILGGDGNDLVEGGSGRDDLTGGGGEDLFAFTSFDRGFDVVRDFVPGTDRLGIDHQDIIDLESLRFVQYRFEDEPSTLIRFLDKDGEVDRSMGGVVLKNILPTDLSEEDFAFGEPEFHEEQQGEHEPLVIGTDDADSIVGTDFWDHIFAMRGDDKVVGGSGNDLIDGGKGRDDLAGGDGEDLFVFSDFGHGFDVVRDFSLGADQVVFDHQDVLILEDLRFIKYSFEGKPSTLIRLLDEDGEVDRSMGGVVLKGVLPSDLSDEDFEFGEPQLTEDQQGGDEAQTFGSDSVDKIEDTGSLDPLFTAGGDATVDGRSENDITFGGEGRNDLTGDEDDEPVGDIDSERSFNVIRDFALGTDQVVFDDQDALILEDLRFSQHSFEEEPSTLIRFLKEDGPIDGSKGGVILKGILPSELSDEDFGFGDAANHDDAVDEFAVSEKAFDPASEDAVASYPSDQELMDALYDSYECTHDDSVPADDEDDVEKEWFI